MRFESVFSCPQEDYKLDCINYEGDVEKMRPESIHSSDFEETVKAEVPTVKPSTQTQETHSDTLKYLEDQHPSQSVRNWLQRITQMQNDIQRKLNLEQNSSPTHSFTEFPVKPSSGNSTQTASRVIKYQDLPYMGEMTLDNSKPRRGRKPKKADICHLIYKNYGTIFPGTPNSKNPLDKENAQKKSVAETKSRTSPVPETINRSDVQNRIISSLLEKRLTQESKRQKESLVSKSSKATTKSSIVEGQNEPLNLCIRDLNQLKIRLLKKQDSTYSSELRGIKSEPTSDDEVEFVHETPSPSSSHSKELKFPNLSPEAFSAAFLSPDAVKSPENGVAPGGYVYWPNAGVFIHPMALQQQLMYYQKLAANNNYTLPSHSPRPPPETTPSPEVPPSEYRKIVPKTKSKKTDANPEPDPQNQHETKPKRNASVTEKTPTKRKRSAIFIPPIPTENQTNPATEVSICKFKFTGGAKPSLQEKKMLSVDSGGNFRYYSGTGDKSMRGYEFFPRETLQQQAGSQGSSTGAFLQASGEKIPPSAMIEFTGKQDFMLTPDLQQPPLQTLPEMGPRHKKRKTRKSLQREKLEQTFKEKGFLIQTQQLESAEGATYCKFRQLRKFTRYLFRSWKDYLPGNVAEVPEGERSETDEVNEQDIENLSRLQQGNVPASDIPSTS